MNNPLQGYAGTSYNATVALAVVALVFSPAVLFLSRASGVLPISIAVAISCTCRAGAFFSWKRYSTLTIPSIVA